MSDIWLGYFMKVDNGTLNVNLYQQNEPQTYVFVVFF